MWLKWSKPFKAHVSETDWQSKTFNKGLPSLHSSNSYIPILFMCVWLILKCSNIHCIHDMSFWHTNAGHFRWVSASANLTARHSASVQKSTEAAWHSSRRWSYSWRLQVRWFCWWVWDCLPNMVQCRSWCCGWVLLIWMLLDLLVCVLYLQKSTEVTRNKEDSFHNLVKRSTPSSA